MNSKIAVIGLGYVGLPLAVVFGKKVDTIGYDISASKIDSYRRHIDPTAELSSAEMQEADRLHFTADPAALRDADFIVIAVPTPVDSAHQPDFAPLIAASTTAGKNMKKGATVIYESTVYPGATEEICVPILEKASGMRWMQDFNVGYSPERINPGDKEHTVSKIRKVVSGDTAATLDRVARLYEAVIAAGVYKAASIKVAEAAKVIENTQRDVNVALMNELAIICEKIGIDTMQVLNAASTKWNFLPFKPGLVGGHCIGVDPYYLTHKAEMIGYHPQMILAGRRINDGMGKFIAEQTIKRMIRAGSNVKDASVIVLGLTFKENCPDLRNSKVIDIIQELTSFGAKVFVHDPVADPAEAEKIYGIELKPWSDLPVADAIVACVAHPQFAARPVADYVQKLIPAGCFIDVKSMLDADSLRNAGLTVWRL